LSSRVGLEPALPRPVALRTRLDSGLQLHQALHNWSHCGSASRWRLRRRGLSAVAGCVDDAWCCCFVIALAVTCWVAVRRFYARCRMRRSTGPSGSSRWWCGGAGQGDLRGEALHGLAVAALTGVRWGPDSAGVLRRRRDRGGAHCLGASVADPEICRGSTRRFSRRTASSAIVVSRRLIDRVYETQEAGAAACSRRTAAATRPPAHPKRSPNRIPRALVANPPVIWRLRSLRRSLRPAAARAARDRPLTAPRGEEAPACSSGLAEGAAVSVASCSSSRTA